MEPNSSREVSSHSGRDRTCEELKKKWSDLKSTAKKDLSKYRRETKRTGGGPPPPPPDQIYEKIVQIIGEEAIEGMNGGIDTGEPDQPVDGEQDEGDNKTVDSTSSQRRPEKRRRVEDGASVAERMLETQQDILNALKELTDAQKRSVYIQERFLALEEHRTFGRFMTEPAMNSMP